MSDNKDSPNRAHNDPRYTDVYYQDKSARASAQATVIRLYMERNQEAFLKAFLGSDDFMSDSDYFHIVLPEINERLPVLTYIDGQGIHQRVYPGNHPHKANGNKKYYKGDKIKKPRQGQGKSGTQGSNDPEQNGQKHVFNKRDFIKDLFKNLVLPNLKSKPSTKFETLIKRCGYTTEGTPATRDNRRTIIQAKRRRSASFRPQPEDKERFDEIRPRLRFLKHKRALTPEEEQEKEHLQIELDNIKARGRKAPRFDPKDNVYMNFEEERIPIAQAVLFLKMDISASMGVLELSLAKLFFGIQFMFLQENYETAKVEFIRHHTDATRVSEAEFFEHEKTGGTMVSSAFQLMREIIKADYPPEQWNIYSSYCSDGENWDQDQQTLFYNLQEIKDDFSFACYLSVARVLEHDVLIEVFEEAYADNPQLFKYAHARDEQGVVEGFQQIFQPIDA